MTKPTIFFSHSSKDKDIISKIKSRLNIITSDTLDIFLSSDGQSIPFGTNWVHKIEESLRNATIMFVFVTPNSIRSDWIYFEAGFTYSKGIKVIPVGLGIDIGSLKPPLNLLQGFNIQSVESLNNFIEIINKHFDFNFTNTFTTMDYITFLPSENSSVSYDFGKYLETANFEQNSEYGDNAKGITKYDNKLFFTNIVDYLETNNISYSINNAYKATNVKCILVSGLKIKLDIGIANGQDALGHIKYKDLDLINFSFSSYNLFDSLNLYIKLMELVENRDLTYIVIKPTENCDFVVGDEKLSAIIAKSSNIFSQSINEIGRFVYTEKDIKFRTSESNESGKSFNTLILQFPLRKTDAKDIIQMLGSLIDNRIIFERAK